MKGHNDHAANAAIGIGVPYDVMAALLADGPVRLPKDVLRRWGFQHDTVASQDSPATNAWLVARLYREYLDAAGGDERIALQRMSAVVEQATVVADTVRPSWWGRLKGWARGLLA